MKINLTGGDDQARSVVASCQRTLNLYAEATDRRQGEPSEVTHYPTPGLTLLGVTPNGLPIRGLYRASNGDLYCAAGFAVYYISPSWAFNLIGTMTTTSVLNPVKFADNGTNVILCDGTPTNGYAITMATRSGLANLYDPTVTDIETPEGSIGWYGSTYVDFSDTYLIANQIGTPNFYISNSEDVVFDRTQLASKSAYPDVLIGAIVQHRVIWLIGELNTEVWYNAGSDAGASLGITGAIPFELMPGVAIDWGCAATYSIAKAATSIFFLAQHQNGQNVVLKGSGYSVQRISTHAIEYQLSTYSTIADCIAYCYLQNGHSFYVMNFPAADKTLVYDLSANQWHERCYTDDNGNEHMQRSTMHAFAYNKNIVNDWQNGNLYELDLNNYTDNGQFIKRLIGFPRQIDSDDDHRVNFQSFTAEISSGESKVSGNNPQIVLRWSDDKGRTWSNGVEKDLGGAGHFNQIVQWNRLGLSRNRVFQLEWSANALVALQGAFVMAIKAAA